MNSQKFEVRMLLLVGVLCAGAATYVKDNDNAFGLWSNLSSLCAGASIGILQERKEKDDNKY